MKRIFILSFIILSAVLSVSAAGAAEAQDGPRMYNASLDLVGSGAFAPSGGPSFAGGLGASAFVAFRPAMVLSLGMGLDYMDYPGAKFSTASWTLGGRLFPFAREKAGEWYFQGNAGLNLVTETLDNSWPGNYRASAGAGYSFFVGNSGALDLGVQYDFFTPHDSPLQALGVKAGWSFLFGDPLEEAPAPKSVIELPPPVKAAPASKGKKKPKKKATPVSTPVPTPASNH
jgi:hypothetical protein